MKGDCFTTILGVIVIFGKIAAVYLIIINIAAALVTVYDKRAAQTGKRRISERALLIVAAVGGSIGMYITMRKIRHKTKHTKFMLGIPVIIVIQLLIFALAVYFL